MGEVVSLNIPRGISGLCDVETFSLVALRRCSIPSTPHSHVMVAGPRNNPQRDGYLSRIPQVD